MAGLDFITWDHHRPHLSKSNCFALQQMPTTPDTRIAFEAATLYFDLNSNCDAAIFFRRHGCTCYLKWLHRAEAESGTNG